MASLASPFILAKAGHDFLFRLTNARWKAYRRQAELIDWGPGWKSYSLTWIATAKDHQSNPELPPGVKLQVVLHEIKLDNGTRLYLVTRVPAERCDATAAGNLYLHRYDVEFDIRDLKVTMDTENILARSVVMVKKELFTSVVAYNLITTFRRQAAQLAGGAPRRLSFKGVWTSFRDRLLLQAPATFEQWRAAYVAALISADNRKLPNRSKPRSSPRVAHPRRQKRTKFTKNQANARQAQAAQTDPTPPI